VTDANVISRRSVLCRPNCRYGSSDSSQVCRS